MTIRYLEPDFTAMFLAGLRGLTADGTADAGYHGRELARNAAVAGLALATGLRRQEFTYLLPWEIPALPARPTTMPVPFPVPAGVTKGRKFRTTWVSYDALAEVHHYLELDRAATADGSAWRPPPRWGEPLLVTGPDERGGRVNGVRRRWETLTPGERRRLVAPGRRVVPAGREERRRPVHRVGDGVRADVGPDPGHVRAAVPARDAPPAKAHLLDADP